MYDFLDKLINITIPRLRDFRGLEIKSFDNQGNYTIGIREHIIFPEIIHHGDLIHPLEVTITVKAKNKNESYKLLKRLGFPLKDKENEEK